MIPALKQLDLKQELASITGDEYKFALAQTPGRLKRIWVDWPIYFITTCTVERRAILACKEIAESLIDEWRCRAELDAKELPLFMQKWKQWTSKRAMRELKLDARLWQEEFFDHLLRSGESYSQKWDYVKENPARAGLVDRSDAWPWQGEIEPPML